ncbi:MAG: GTP cyclohydrolase FolE2 [bacterium]
MQVQNSKEERGIAIEEVGITKVMVPLSISDKANGKQQVVATVNMSVNLPGNRRGTHMSRFIEVIKEYRGYDFNNNSLDEVLLALKNRLNADSAFLELSFDYFIEKVSPASKEKSLMHYECKIIGKLFEDKKETYLEVFVPISSVCPCSLAISDTGAHNQRGIVHVTVKTNEFVWLEDLITLIERCGSGEMYALLKRDDEKYVTEKMFANPKFVEDVVRDIAVELGHNTCIDTFCVECTSYESIHNHNAYAKITKK